MQHRTEATTPTSIPRHLTALLAAAVIAASAPTAFASSDFDTGVLQRRDPATGTDLGFGICRLFVGPRGEVPGGRFLLRIGDDDAKSSYELELTGTATPDGTGSYVLSADEQSAQEFYEDVLQRALRLRTSDFDLRQLVVEVERTDLDLAFDDITCSVRLDGSIVTDPSPLTSLPTSPRGPLQLIRSAPVQLRYTGAGTYFEPATASAATSGDTATTAAANCPAPDFTPLPAQCGTPNCLVTFAGYQWWTEYNFFPPPTYFYNNNNAWAPKNVTVDGEGLHLFVQQQDLGGGQVWAAAEAATALALDGSVANLGYGTYLVAAKVKTASSWSALDPNVAFGVFTYERDRTGDVNNPGRELDLAEVSRWGHAPGTPCRISPPALCPGNSQFTVQNWDAQPDNLHRYTINDGVDTITLVMKWPGANQPVTFSQYDGAYTLDTLPATPANTWTTSADQNRFIPADGCQQFHLNLWMGDFTDAANGYNPPPAGPQEVVVTNFQYRP
jgi:hypothetical protein